MMRTTLTLDEDVAALLARVQEIHHLGLKQTVNEALRQGLKHMLRPAQPQKPFKTKTVDLGQCLVGNLDDVAGLVDHLGGKSG